VGEAEVGVCEGGGEAAAASVEVAVDATSRVVDEAGVSGLLGHEWFLFLRWIWKITGGNAEVCENR
jgi:putative NIF3 family GTP cyclohydrolase 1 type 2